MSEGGKEAAIELRLDGGLGAQAAAGAAVRAIATAAGVPDDRTTRLRVVVEELVREARSRERAGEASAVTVRARTDSGRLRVEVVDLALPVSAAESRAAASRRLAALGFVDELHIRSHGKSGNVAECAVRLSAPDEDLMDEEVLSPEAPEVDKETELEIRLMEPGEAMGLVRCIYRCYGYSYKDPMLYEPRHIARAIRERVLHSVVAVTPEDEIVGHCALWVELRGDPVPEAGKLVVDPRFRGHHLAERMAKVRRQIAEDASLAGFWGQAVTNHPASQREVVRLGGAEVGLLIGASPAEVSQTALDNPTQGRRTLIAVFTPLNPVSRVLHLPDRHRDFVLGLAHLMGLERDTSAEHVPASGSTRLRTSVFAEPGFAHVRIEQLGGDTASRVADELEGLDAFDLGAIHLDIALTDPAAAPAIEELEPLGFSIAAWLPTFTSAGDVLRLQRTGGHPVDVEHLVCARPEGEAVRDYVVDEWHRVRRGGVA